MAVSRPEEPTRPEGEPDDGSGARTRMVPALAVVAALSILGAVATLVLSPHGVHATPDSFTYLGAADSLARGDGWTYPFGDVGAPVTLFPPLYPTVLALPELFGIDSFAWVTWQNAVLLAVFCAVVGVTVANATRGSAGAAAVAVVLTQLGTPTIVTYARIWSESLFLPLTVGAIACLGRFLDGRRRRWLVAAGVLTSLAMLTRYAGLPIFATSCLLLALWPGRALVDRARSVALYAGFALPLSGLWLFRNQVRSGTLTGDNRLIHDLAPADVLEGFRTIGAWFVHDPIEDPTQWLFTIVTVGAALLVALSVAVLVRRGEVSGIRIAPIVAVCLVFVVMHITFIAVANAFSTRAPPFNDRILGPAFVPLVIAIVVLGNGLWRAAGRRSLLKAALGVAAVSVVASSAIAAVDPITRNFTTRGGSVEAYADLSRPLARSIDPGSVLLSNRPNIAWFLVDRHVGGLPKSCRGGRILPSLTYPRDLRRLSDHLGDDPRQVLVFKKSKDCEPFSLEGLMRTLRLTRLARVPRIIVLEGPVPP